MNGFIKISAFFILFFAFTTSLLAKVDSLDMEHYIKENKLKVKRDDNGIAYIIDENGSGTKAKTGDFVLVNYKGMTLNGTVFDESPEKEGFAFQLDYRQVIQGLDKGLLQLSKGAKARMFIPANKAYGKHGVGDIVKPNMDLMYEVELVKIMTPREYDQYIIKLEEKERIAFENHIKEQFAKDKKLIQEYAMEHKLRAKRTSKGVSYVITKKGKGEDAKPGDVVTVEYEGYLLDDSLFDTNKNQSYKFKLGIGKVIEGWDDALTNFNKGAEGVLLIPSKLAYGPRSIREENINIPSNSILIFKVKMVEIELAQQIITKN